MFVANNTCWCHLVIYMSVEINSINFIIDFISNSVKFRDCVFHPQSTSFNIFYCMYVCWLYMQFFIFNLMITQ